MSLLEDMEKIFRQNLQQVRCDSEMKEMKLSDLGVNFI